MRQRRSHQPDSQDKFRGQNGIGAEKGKGQSPVIAQWTVKVEYRMAVAKGKLRKPAGIECTCPYSLIEGHQAVDMEQAIMRIEQSFPCQGRQRGKDQDHDPQACWNACEPLSQSLQSSLHVGIIAWPIARGK